MNRSHTLCDKFKYFIPLYYQQTFMPFLNNLHQIIQSRNFFIIKFSLSHSDHPDLIQGIIDILFARQIILFISQTVYHIDSFVEDLYLIFKESFYILQVIFTVKEIFFPFQNTIDQRNIVFLLRQNICHKFYSLQNQLVIRIICLRSILIIQFLIMSFLL